MSDLSAAERLDTATVRLDIEGGLEVRKPRGAWWIAFPVDDQPVDWALTFTRKRNAVAVRALMLAVVPDFDALPKDARGLPTTDDADIRQRLTAIVRMVKTVNERRLNGLCPRCGWADTFCSCVTGEPADGPRYSDEELAWTR